MIGISLRKYYHNYFLLFFLTFKTIWTVKHLSLRTDDLIMISEQLKKDISSPKVRDQIKFETGSDFAIDASKRMKDEVASFRKLNVD